MNYFKKDKPFVVPTTDGKLIEEHFGMATTQTSNLSIVHMVAPPGWSDPPPHTEFTASTFMSRGKQQFALDVQELIV